MMFARIAILLICTGAMLSAAGSADEAVTGPTGPTNATGTTLESFRIISERNIFNQNRSTRSTRREETTTRRPPVVQSLSLVGTMSYAKGDFAFFDGTRPEYKKPAKIGEQIAGYEVKEIKPNGVKIANETNQFEIKVGQQLRREDESDWKISSAPVPVQSTSSDAGAPVDAGASGAPGSEDEALKRLMEKRAKEMNQ
jgi:hypothetical protein